MYAVIKTGGKQYRVSAGDKVRRAERARAFARERFDPARQVRAYLQLFAIILPDTFPIQKPSTQCAFRHKTDKEDACLAVLQLMPEVMLNAPTFKHA